MKMKVVKKQKNARSCFICGVANTHGLQTRYYELEDGSVAGLTVARPFHQSYPGRVHGGVITAMLDETLCRSITPLEPETWAVTGRLETRYLKPVPYDVPLIITGRVTRNRRLLFEAEGKILLPDGTVAAKASGTFMKQRLDNIADFDAHGDSWELYTEPGDPSELDIPQAEE